MIHPRSALAPRRSGVTLFEFLIVVVIIGLVWYFACSGSGSPTAAAKAAIALADAQNSTTTAATMISMASSPEFQCDKAASLTADIAAAQAKIDQAARDYPADYATRKAAIERAINTVNQNIQLYNHHCGSNVPLLTLPP